MPKTKKDKLINLLPSDNFDSSVIGRIIKWVLTSFRFMVIVCELIVMGAFLSRFWLDAKNSDLNENLEMVTAQISSYKDFETEFRNLQKRILISENLYKQNKITDFIDTISQNMPNDLILKSVSMGSKETQLDLSALSEKSIIQFLYNLESSKKFKEVKLSQVSSDTDGLFIKFSVALERK